MPELPEVETVCRRLRKEAGHAEIVAFRIARPAIAKPQDYRDIEARVSGRVLSKVERRGKNIIIRFDSGDALRIHLRMTGNLYWVPDIRFRPVNARAWFELAGGAGIVFEDPRALGRIHLHTADEIAQVLEELGPEPLSKQFTEASFLERAKLSRQPSKLYLMDQTNVAGLGNIYAAEALFQAGISPSKPMNKLRPERLRALHHAIVGVLSEAVRCVSMAYSRPGRMLEAEAFPLAVYGRENEPCTTCGKKIRRIAQGGRSTYYCPGCQR